MSEEAGMVEVTQADRDRAAHVHAARYGSATPGYQWILEGEQDDDVLVQAFARYRQAVIEEAGAQRGDVDDIAEIIVRAVSELPDRTSPNGWSEAMLVTPEELHLIVVSALTPKDST